jgi:hypothetical protein
MKVEIVLTNTEKDFHWDITIDGEIFHMYYNGGTIETMKNGRFFFDTPHFGVTDTQQLFKLEPVKYEFKEIK